MDKDNTTDRPGPWHEIPVEDSTSVTATSTAIPYAEVMTPTSSSSQENLQVPAHRRITPNQS